MREHSVNSLNNFIGGWYMDDTTLCDDIINYFNSGEGKKWAGRIFNQNGLVVDTTQKKSIEMVLDENRELHNRYLEHLDDVIKHYGELYPMCLQYSKFTNTEITKLQYYPSDGGYYPWHTERGTAKKPVADRNLVFLTYLNDLEDGETEFYHQKLKIKPEKGLTLIWGSDWTFTHRGIPSKSEKYIVTGWLNYID